MVSRTGKSDFHELDSNSSVVTRGPLDAVLVLGIAECGCHRASTRDGGVDMSKGNEGNCAKSAGRRIFSIDQIGAALGRVTCLCGVGNTDEQLHRSDYPAEAVATGAMTRSSTS